MGGKISEERYLEMLEAYESEQSEIKVKLTEYENKKSIEKSTKNDVDKFIKLVNEYSDIKELTLLILSEFIEEIRLPNSFGSALLLQPFSSIYSSAHTKS